MAFAITTIAPPPQPERRIAPAFEQAITSRYGNPSFIVGPGDKNIAYFDGLRDAYFSVHRLQEAELAQEVVCRLTAGEVLTFDSRFDDAND